MRRGNACPRKRKPLLATQVVSNGTHIHTRTHVHTNTHTNTYVYICTHTHIPRQIDPWWLNQHKELHDIGLWLRTKTFADLDAQDMQQLKRRGFADSQLARLLGAFWLLGCAPFDCTRSDKPVHQRTLALLFFTCSSWLQPKKLKLNVYVKRDRFIRLDCLFRVDGMLACGI